MAPAPQPPPPSSPTPLPVPNPLPSLWLDGIALGSTAPFPAQDGKDNLYDVAVIGAGFSGSSVAYHLRLLRPTLRIAVLDARDVSGGATGRNGGLLWPGLTDHVEVTIRRFGLERALELLHFDLENVAELRKFCDGYTGAGGGDTPDPQLMRFPDGGVHVLKTADERVQARADLDALARAGQLEASGLELWDAEKTAAVTGGDPHIAGYGALVCHHTHRVIPPRLVLAILRRATARVPAPGPGLPGRPADFFAHTPVQRVSRRPLAASAGAFSFELSTPHGVILARRVVHATNAWSAALLPRLPVAPVRNQVIATHPLAAAAGGDDTAAWTAGRFGISANDGYEYMSGRGDGRAVLGGMRFLAPNYDVGVADDSRLNPDVSAALRDYLPRHFSTLRRAGVQIDREWAGIMGFSADGHPFVGELPAAYTSSPAAASGGASAADSGSSTASSGGAAAVAPAAAPNPATLPPPGSGEFVCAGFCGHGMPRCFLSARAVAEMVAGVPVSRGFPRLFLPTDERLGAAHAPDGFRSRM
ncbi:hypothetical protein HK405_004546 [Cladochytrium tenue]|nr:hypothetical protein HK405_004546 [Cladochytrium tenue]